MSLFFDLACAVQIEGYDINGFSPNLAFNKRIFHFIFRARFLQLSRDGQGRFIWEFLFLGFVSVFMKSVQMAGILQVFAFLIIPAFMDWSSLGMLAKC